MTGGSLRGYTDLMILRVLLNGDSYGYEISKRIIQIAEGTFSLKETTLYSAFTRMENSRFIESYPGSVTHGKPRTYYHITDEGRMAYRDKCQEWQELTRLINRFTQEEEAHADIEGLS